MEGLRLRLTDRFLKAPLGDVEGHSIGEIKSIMVEKIENMETPIALASLVFLLIISKYSTKNAPVLAAANRDLTGAVLEYARSLSVVKSFGKAGASMDAMKKACRDSRDINLKIERGYIPYNALHLLALKMASVCIVIAAFYLGVSGQIIH